jgi:hypothetical protein
MNRLLCLFVLACATLAGSARPALAQQTVNVSYGYLMMSSAGRAKTDILLIEHGTLLFDINDFNGATVGGEWLIPIGNFFEAGAGASFSRGTVPTINLRVANRDGSNVTRDLTLRQMPMALSVRLLPLGQSYIVQPYVGGGVVIFRWRFRESGDFVGPTQNIFHGDYEATGKTPGPMMVFGLRVARGRVAYGFEARYQHARGHFDPIFANVRNPDIDLGGWALQFTAGMRFRR